MPNKTVLVTGGAGYIGSAIVKLMCKQPVNRFTVHVIDSLENGRKSSVNFRSYFYSESLLNYSFLDKLFSTHKFDAVIHTAAYKSVKESEEDPKKYNDNISSTLNLLNVMCKYNVRKIIFSSSAAVYGNQNIKKLSENDETIPINYYGMTKLICEQIIQNYTKAYNISYIIFRFFNVVGDCGIKHNEKEITNLFPIIKNVIDGIHSYLLIFGNNFDTKDGTCIRDYIHVEDVARAHIMALYVSDSNIFNLGSGKGYTVMEIVKQFEKAGSCRIPVRFTEKRKGDPEILVADCKKVNTILKWQPRYTLDDAVKSSIL